MKLGTISIQCRPLTFSAPELEQAEWRYVQTVVGEIASNQADDYVGLMLAESIRTKIYNAIGVPNGS